jgi:hypothetical protein
VGKIAVSVSGTCNVRNVEEHRMNLGNQTFAWTDISRVGEETKEGFGEETRMTGPIIAVMKAPTDPEQKKEWAYHIMRLQIAMWVDDGAECAFCHVKYANTDDFLNRNPKRGAGKDHCVDTACWDAYSKVFGEIPEGIG